MPSGAPGGSESRSKTGWAAAARGSWSTLCFVPDGADKRFYFLFNFKIFLIRVIEKKGYKLNRASPSFWSWWSNEPGLWRTAPEQIVAGCSASDGLLWAETAVSWSQTQYLRRHRYPLTSVRIRWRRQLGVMFMITYFSYLPPSPLCHCCRHRNKGGVWWPPDDLERPPRWWWVHSLQTEPVSLSGSRPLPPPWQQGERKLIIYSFLNIWQPVWWNAVRQNVKGLFLPLCLWPMDNLRLTCHPKRQRPLLPADRPPCRSLLLPLRRLKGGVRSSEGCRPLKNTQTKTPIECRPCSYLTREYVYTARDLPMLSLWALASLWGS